MQSERYSSVPVAAQRLGRPKHVFWPLASARAQPPAVQGLNVERIFIQSASANLSRNCNAATMSNLKSLDFGTDHRVENRIVMLHSQLKRPTISTLFQRPSEGVGKCDFRVTAAGGKKMMAIQTTKGVTAATHTP